MKTITKIEANRSAAVHRKCRVAAYCRVSTEHDDQIESLETHPSVGFPEIRRSASLLFGNYQELGFPFSLKKKT